MNYLRPLADLASRLIAADGPGGAYVAEIRHDALCALLAGRGACNCNPEIQARPMNRRQRRAAAAKARRPQ